MPLFEVAVRRRLVGRMERGEEVVRAIANAALRHGIDEGEVRAQGRLAWVEIAGAGPGVSERRDGPFEVVSMSGRVRVVDGEPAVTVTVHAVHAVPGLAPAAGRLVASAAIALDVVVEVWDAAVAASAPAKPPAPPPKQAAWARVVEASERRPERDAPPPQALPKQPPRTTRSLDLDEPAPDVGDDVQHPQFGRCRVVECSDDKISIRLPSGRIVQLGSAVLKYGMPEDEDGRRVFPVEVRIRK